MSGRSSATPRHLALVGPTASAKSAIAMRVAETFGDVEIVSLDSMQVYRGLDIGTAKPTPDERARVPHHLVDVVEPHDDWSVARTQRAARDAVADIEARGKRALLVGGTGLYVQAVVDDLAIPGEDLAIRAELEAFTSEPGGMLAAYQELTARDPLAASRIDEHNQRRVVRALEVIRSTGRPFSSFGPGLDRYGPTAFDVALIGIWLPRDTLARRIESRVDAMRAAGFVDEVRALAARPAGLSRTAAQAIGYQELLAHLRGELALDDALALAVRRTRSFARRQRMWFRRDPRITWLGTDDDPMVLTAGVLARWTPPTAAPDPDPDSAVLAAPRA
ncbi:MAG TPA: tRNA (adenosine(37)-N6)-dimethylallyltransferase MiaA [Acidimicrobiia bacterium]|nr:tRNA (adenosine(37)-N6)-dimethylallyltransferase MiaA [Acidimicrobiia bacterium]